MNHAPPSGPPGAPPSETFEKPIDQETRRYLLRNLLYLGIGVLALVVLAAAAQRLFGEQLRATSHWLTDTGGYLGVGVTIWVIDTFTLPMSPDVILAFAAHDGSRLNHGAALAVICAASVLAGNTGFYLARWIGDRKWVRRKLAKNYDRGHRLFQRFGVWAVVIAGLTPVPFSVICWLAGVYQMSPTKLFFATWSRIPRFVGWYFIIRFGFSL